MMPDRPIDLTLLGEFEQGLNVRWPEKSRIPARVLGYGEISTVLEIQAAPAEGLAYKRMPMFRDEAEAARSMKPCIANMWTCCRTKLAFRWCPEN